MNLWTFFLWRVCIFKIVALDLPELSFVAVKLKRLRSPGLKDWGPLVKNKKRQLLQVSPDISVLSKVLIFFLFAFLIFTLWSAWTITTIFLRNFFFLFTASKSCFLTEIIWILKFQSILLIKKKKVFKAASGLYSYFLLIQCIIIIFFSLWSAGHSLALTSLQSLLLFHIRKLSVFTIFVLIQFILKHLFKPESASPFRCLLHINPLFLHLSLFFY